MIALYHFITLLLYCIYHFTVFIAFITSLLCDEETLPPPSHYRYRALTGFLLAPGTAGSFAGYAYLVLGCLYLVSSALPLWLTVALILVFTPAGIWAANRLRHLGDETLRAWWSMKWSVCGLLLAAPAGHVWYALGRSCSVCLIYSNPWAFTPYGKSAGGIGVNDGRYSVQMAHGRDNFDCGKMDKSV